MGFGRCVVAHHIVNEGAVYGGSNREVGLEGEAKDTGQPPLLMRGSNRCSSR